MPAKNKTVEIKQIISAVSNKEEKMISDKTKLIKDLQMDSLEILEVVSDIEKKYKIKIVDEDLYDVLTVADLVKLTERYIDQLK